MDDMKSRRNPRSAPDSPDNTPIPADALRLPEIRTPVNVDAVILELLNTCNETPEQPIKAQRKAM